MWIANAKIRGRNDVWAIEVKNGIFSAIVPMDEAPKGLDMYDCNGRLMSPPFVENHIHLDYAKTAGVPRANASGTLFEAIEIWAERKSAGIGRASDITANALAAARSAASYGVGFIRTHVDVTDPSLSALKAMLELKKDIAPWVELQVVAFPQNGIIAFPDGASLMDKAMELGADVVGGIPHLEPTREDGIKSLEIVFDLAEKYNALVDVHCDEIDDEQSRFLEVMAAETVKRQMQGRVTASHVVAMAYYGPGYMARLMPKLKAAQIGFAICPNENLQLQGRGINAPTPRGMAPVKVLTEWGLDVAFCQDSIEDPWYPIGSGNPLRNLDAGLHVGHMLTADNINRCLDYVSTNPAKNMQLLDRHGIEVGKPANLIVLDASFDKDVLQFHAPVLLSMRNGRVIFQREPVNTRWWL